MKLGDKMTTVDARNLWGDACPRKTRPPRIGDIPRYTAVDEESPGAASRRLASTSPCVDSRGTETMLELRLTTHGDVFSAKTSPVQKSSGCEGEDPLVKSCTRLSGMGRSTTASHPRSDLELEEHELSPETGIPSVKVIEEMKLKLDMDSLARTSNPGEERASLIRIGSTPSREIREVRKDSALYLEEVEGLQNLRDNLQKSRSPKRLTPRRESSGYASNLGTFDDERRSSEIDVTAIRERRRSSTKRLTSETFQPRRLSRNEDNSNVCDTSCGGENIIATVVEAQGRASVSGLDMSDIQEMRDAEYAEDETSLQRVSPLPEVGRFESAVRIVSTSPIRDSSDSDKCPNTALLPASKTPSTSDKNSLIPKPVRLAELKPPAATTVVASLPESGTNAAILRKRLVRTPSEHLSYAEVLSKSANRTSSRSKLAASGDKTTEEDPSIAHEVSSGFDQFSGRGAHRKRIVHQYSTPNFSTTELESILEKPVEKSSDHQPKDTTVTVQLPKTSSAKEEADVHSERVSRSEIGSMGAESVEDSPTSEGKRVTGPPNTTCHAATPSVTLTPNRSSEDLELPRNSLLPKSVKVYQLLSTQSEDRGDGVPNLADRRISLQMTRQSDDRVPLDSTESEESSRIASDQPEIVPILSVSGAEATSTSCHLAPSTNVGTPVRKLSTPAEMGSSQRLLADSGISIRPIYPYCPYSPYGSPQGSPRTRRRPLRESRRVSIDNRQGALQLNQYKLFDNIGQGSYGIVKLAYNEEDETHYAMKILSKKKLMKKAGIFGRMAPGRKGNANPLAKVYREIALLKKLDHPNVVKLVEVLDDPDEDNLYLVFELVQKGEVLQLPAEQPLDEDVARIHFRDIVLGVEYLHYQRIVHRDIKPSNLLVDSDGRVKIADLGVSAELRAAGELLSGSAGTPAFAAPETTTPGAQYSGTLCDVWSMGVTLYSFVTGRVPWDGAGSIIGVQAAVRSEPLKFPEKPKISESLRDLITRMLEKDPNSRISLTEIKIHPWVTKDGTEMLPSEADNCRLPVTVTDEEVARVVTRVPKLDTLILIKTMLKQHSFQNPFLPKRSAKSVSGDTPPSESLSMSTNESVASESSKGRAEKFHEAGRSNSAPDTYDCNYNDRQVSVESPLPSVTEALAQEIDSSER